MVLQKVINFAKIATKRDTMDKLSMLYLALKYPAVSSYIINTWLRGNDQEIMDFLFALETGEGVQYH